MIRLLAHLIVNGIGIWIISQLLPGIHYGGGWLYLLLAGLVVGLVNWIVKPVVTILSLPFIIVTLGLFLLVINGAMLWLVDALLDGFTVDGCGSAILGGLVMAIYNWLTNVLLFRS